MSDTLRGCGLCLPCLVIARGINNDTAISIICYGTKAGGLAWNAKEKKISTTFGAVLLSGSFIYIFTAKREARRAMIPFTLR